MVFLLQSNVVHCYRVRIPQLYSSPQNYGAEAHSWQRTSSRRVRNPWPTSETEHFAQLKHSPCHWRSSNETNLAPPTAERNYEKEDVNLAVVQKWNRLLFDVWSGCHSHYKHTNEQISPVWNILRWLNWKKKDFKIKYSEEYFKQSHKLLVFISH